MHLLVFAWLVCALLAFSFRSFRRYRHISKIPGPKSTAYSSIWLIRTYASKRSREIFHEVNQQYGSLARIGPNHVLTDDAEFTWKVLSPKSEYRRGRWFDSLRFDPHFTSIASETDPVKHDALRNKVSAGYTARNLPNLDNLIKYVVLNWIRPLEDRASTPFDLARSVRNLTMNISGHITFSRSLDLRDGEPESDAFWESMEENAPYAQYLSTWHWLFSLTWYLTLIPGVKKRLLLTEHNNPGIGRVLKYSRIATERRFARDAKPINDMLGSWVQHGLSQHAVETETSIALVTGAFPTAAAINVVFLQVSRNPTVKAELLNEIRTAPGSSKYFPDICNLGYLQACILEALRLSPPITQLRERVVPQSGDTVNGYYLPEGTNVGLNTQSLQRHPCFGPDSDVFRPNRWLSADEENLAMMKKVHALIFGYGGTKCLGINQAMMTIARVVFEFWRRFDIELLDPDKPWVDQSSGVSFHRDFFVRLVKT